MPPIRRYLRITQFSVLEVRIYLDNPADAQRWLLNVRDPVLPRVIAAVRPLVLPKLQEENARAKAGKSGKKKGWKDVVHEDDFEVVVFLTETSSRHSILRKEKRAKAEKGRLGTVGGKMTGTQDVPVEVDEGVPGLLREASDQDGARISDIPEDGQRRGAVAKQETEEELFVSSEEEHGGGKEKSGNSGAREDQADDKKKMALETTYDGFSIYGRILCLVVKRKGQIKEKERAGVSGQAMMEDWIASTQMGQGTMLDE